ncbi:MAG: hypothetical protein IIB19_03675 [Chloroflexi bacterium]|nr:hypothetical protein [Chloroflexota bacterium]
MVQAIAAPVLRQKAQRFFNSAIIPRELSWAKRLSDLHFRLFVVDLHKALSEAFIHDGDGELLRQTLEDWYATAEIDSEPTLAKKLKTPRSRKKYREWKPEP